MRYPAWVNCVDHFPTIADFGTTQGNGSPICIDTRTGNAYYLINEVVTLILAEGLGVFSPEIYGARGDGVTNDTAAFVLLTAAINLAGGGKIVFGINKTYIVGQQTLNNPALGAGKYTNYTLSPTDFLIITGCTKFIQIEGNGSTLKCAPGLKYGTFNVLGAPTAHALPYFGAELGTPIAFMMSIEGNTGGYSIRNLNFDGNIQNLVIGGPWGDTGWQIPNLGLNLNGNTGQRSVENVNSNNFGLDGCQINEDGIPEGSTRYNATFSSIHCKNNGRNNFSLVGGQGLLFDSCTGIEAGKNSNGVSSNPGAGIDIEAEASKKIRQIEFRNCLFSDNYGTGMVADGGDINGVDFYSCKFIGTTNYSIWANKPNMKFHSCEIVGAVVSLYAGGGIPAEAVKFYDCKFNYDVAATPNGVIYGSGGNVIFDSPLKYVEAIRCDIIYNHAGVSANGSVDEMIFTDCSFYNPLGFLAINGRFRGSKTLFKDNGIGFIQTFPNNPIVPGFAGKGHAGEAEDPFTYDAAGVITALPRTIDQSNNREGSATKGDVAVLLVAGTDPSIQVFNVALTANRAVTFTFTKRGQKFRIVRTAAGAFNLTVGAAAKVLAVNQWAIVEWDGASEILTGFGNL
jgi:hypothetical protein